MIKNNRNKNKYINDINLNKRSYIIFFLVLIKSFLIFSNLQAKDISKISYMCADEVGPRLKFSLPNFQESEKKKFSFKMFNREDRTKFVIKSAKIKRKTSPIDDSYFFYKVFFSVDEESNKEIYFEFFPPSHLIIQNKSKAFTDLVCWIADKRSDKK